MRFLLRKGRNSPCPTPHMRPSSHLFFLGVLRTPSSALSQQQFFPRVWTWVLHSSGPIAEAFRSLWPMRPSFLQLTKLVDEVVKRPRFRNPDRKRAFHDELCLSPLSRRLQVLVHPKVLHTQEIFRNIFLHLWPIRPACCCVHRPRRTCTNQSRPFHWRVARNPQGCRIEEYLPSSM